jgi:hypothetical protein
VTTFVQQHGVRVPGENLSPSEIILPSDDMSLAEVTSVLEQENWLEPAAPQQ